MKPETERQAWIVLLLVSLASVGCVFPYILTIQGEVIRSIGQPIELIMAIQLLQSLILFAITIKLGLFFTRKIHFQLPLITAILEKDEPQTILKRIGLTSIWYGIAVAGAIYATDSIFTYLGAGITTHASYAPAWQKLLASVYGGVTEEILMRLFVMTLFIWMMTKLSRQTYPSVRAIRFSILLAAVIFGLGHLPITASLTALTPLVIGRAVLLNGIGGIIFGWLFWKYGLESAMIAHFTADVFLLTLLPLLF